MKNVEGGGVCVNEEIYQDNPARPNFPNYPQAVCPQDLDQEIQKEQKNPRDFCSGKRSKSTTIIKVSKTQLYIIFLFHV